MGSRHPSEHEDRLLRVTADLAEITQRMRDYATDVQVQHMVVDAFLEWVGLFHEWQSFSVEELRQLNEQWQGKML